ncbi:MAG TPA: acylphosphatase [Candidatus Paceibacterota bacterium]|jgi:acylphosphatase|nr:acylphosphatase [Candidatus Paceibacterota bacterium]
MAEKGLLKHLNIKVSGRVQRVGFRYGAKKHAQKLGLVGFARNEADESVYIEAEGDEEALKKFSDWCHRGPWLAKVERVEEEWTDRSKKFNGFLIA